MLSQALSMKAHSILKEASRLENPQAQEEEAQDAEAEEHMSKHLQKSPFKYSTDTVSFLTLGGWDERSHSGDLVWFDTSACVGGWNMTAADVTFSADMEWIGVPDEEVVEMPTIVFQTAFPYIGIPEPEFTPLYESLALSQSDAINANFKTESVADT